MGSQRSHQPVGYSVQNLKAITEPLKDAAAHMTINERRQLRATLEGLLGSIQPFRFMNLPPELRNRIYEYAVTSEHLLYLPATCKHANKPLAVQPAVTRVSRQTRNESLQMFYDTNAFVAHIQGFDTSHLIHFMKSIDFTAMRHIKEIRLFFVHNKKAWDLDVSCAEGLRQLVKFYATWTPSPLAFDVREYLHSNAVVVEDALNLALDIFDNPNTNVSVDERFDAWLEIKRLECHCVNEDGERSVSCSMRDPKRGSWYCGPKWLMEYC